MPPVITDPERFDVATEPVDLERIRLHGDGNSVRMSIENYGLGSHGQSEWRELGDGYTWLDRKDVRWLRDRFNEILGDVK